MRKSWRLTVSSCSSIASAFTGPSARAPARSYSASARSARRRAPRPAPRRASRRAGGAIRSRAARESRCGDPPSSVWRSSAWCSSSLSAPARWRRASSSACSAAVSASSAARTPPPPLEPALRRRRASLRASRDRAATRPSARRARRRPARDRAIRRAALRARAAPLLLCVEASLAVVRHLHACLRLRFFDLRGGARLARGLPARARRR